MGKRRFLACVLFLVSGLLIDRMKRRNKKSGCNSRIELY